MFLFINVEPPSTSLPGGYTTRKVPYRECGIPLSDKIVLGAIGVIGIVLIIMFAVGVI